MCVSVRVCVCVSVCACVRVYACVCVRAHVCVHVRERVDTMNTAGCKLACTECGVSPYLKIKISGIETPKASLVCAASIIPSMQFVRHSPLFIFGSWAQQVMIHAAMKAVRVEKEGQWMMVISCSTTS